MRGKGYVGMLAKDFNRITPAYAGKSSPAAVKVIFGQDHPRLCGEKLWHHRGIRQQEGITPAYAGKSTVYYTIEVIF